MIMSKYLEITKVWGLYFVVPSHDSLLKKKEEKEVSTFYMDVGK